MGHPDQTAENIHWALKSMSLENHTGAKIKLHMQR